MTTAQLASDLAEIKSLLRQQQPRPLTLPEAARYLNLSLSRLYTYTSQNVIPHFKPTNKKIYFLKSDLDDFLLRNRVNPRPRVRQEEAR